MVLMLTNYRTNCSPNSAPSQMVIPETLKLMPIYLLTSLKSPSFSSLLHSNMVDSKLCHVYRFLGISFNKVSYLFYPRVYKISDVVRVVGRQDSIGGDSVGCDWGMWTDDSRCQIVKPKIAYASKDKISVHDTYIMDNGEWLTILVNSGSDAKFI